MTQPGWYQDPAGGPGLRWWDGGQWTAHQQAAPGAGRQAEFPRRQPEIAAPPAAPKPNRRRFLWLAGIGAAGLAAAGGGVAYALTGDPKPTGEPTGSTLPNGPAPTWTQALDKQFNNGDRAGGISVMGDVVVRWDSGMAQAFDTATGTPRWTGDPNYFWIGQHGSSLIGTNHDAETDAALLVAVGPDGKQQFSHNLGRIDDNGSGFTQLFDVAGSIALLNTSDAPGKIAAVDMSGGSLLWTRPLKAFDNGVAVTDGRRCYLQDDTDTVCLDLTTGNQLWAVPNTCPVNNCPAGLALVAGALAIAGDRLIVLDAATGVQRRTALQGATGITRTSGIGVSAGLFVVGQQVETASGDDILTVWGIDPRKGTKVWMTPISEELATSVGTSADLAILPTETERPNGAVQLGIIVLDGKTGAIAWGEQGGLISVAGGGIGEWLACATPDTVYAASQTAVSAYPRHR